jgi:hypothetical protein
MKENPRIAAAIGLRVRQLNLPNLHLPGESNNHTGYCSAALEPLLSAEMDYRPRLVSY